MEPVQETPPPADTGRGLFARLFPRSMPASRYYERTGWAFCAVAVVLAVVPLFVQADRLGTIFVEAFAAFFALRGALRIRAVRRSHPKSVIYRDLSAAPPDVQLIWLRRMIPLGSVAFAVLSGMTAYDLYQLEHHIVGSVLVEWPVGPIYKAFGLWPAVLCFPIQ